MQTPWFLWKGMDSRMQGVIVEQYSPITRAGMRNPRLTIPGRSGSEVLWSWHIWVTNKDLTPVTIGGKRMMDWNLGWKDSDNVSRRVYADRSLQFRVVQTNGEGTVLQGGDTESFTVIQNGDVLYSAANYGTNPYYQWGRKDPLASDAPLMILQYRPHSKYSVAAECDVYIESCEGLHVNDNPSVPAGYGTVDYGSGIMNPRTAVCNSFTSEWVGGPVVPYKHWNVMYHLTGYNATVYEDINPNYYTDNYCIYFWIPGTYTTHSPDIYNLSAFVFDGMFGYPDLPLYTYTEERKTESSASYNLWNAYCWADSDFRSDTQVFKTIYDPCPPGFTVPSRGTYDGAGSPTAHTSGGSTDGILLDGHFFPFTGARSWSYSQGNGVAADSYHWGHTIALNSRGVGTAGYLWTAQREEVAIVEGTNVNRDNKFKGIGGAHIMSYTESAVTLPASNIYTMGSTASIRPLADPQYKASVGQVTGGLEDVEYGDLPTN